MADKNNNKLHVKTSDKVIVLSGKDKGKTGNVRSVDPASSKIVVEGVNMVTKAQKPQPAAGIQGGLIKMEAPMNSSNVMVVCPACDKPTRVQHEIKDDKKVRVCKKCGEQLDV